MEGARTSEVRGGLIGRIAIVLAMGVYFIGGFNVIPLLIRDRTWHELRTPLDDAIPLVPWTVYLYSWVYTSALYPVFVVRGARLFRRIVLAYFTLFTVAWGVFLAYPVTSRDFRPAPASVDASTFHGWGLRLTYLVDPPVNLFPSLHLATAVLSARAVSEASPRAAVLGWIVAAFIAVSIYTTKQHFLVDGVAGLLLALAVDRLLLRGQGARDPEPRSYGPRGPFAYLLFHASVYGTLYAAYRTGLAH